MTRILVLTNMYPPHHLGGYELSCRDVVERMRAHGHEITVLTTTMRLPGVDDAPDERAGGILRDLAFYWDDHRIVNPSIPGRIGLERRNQRALQDALERARPDVVSAWNMGAMSLGLLTTVLERDLPVVLNVCDEWPVYGPTVDAWSRPLVRRPVLARVVRRLTGLPAAPPDLGERAVFLFISDMIRRRVEERSPWKPRTWSIVYNGIDRRDFPPAPDEERPWRWQLLYAGRIDERKGIHIAVEALRALPPEATLEIDGRGDDTYLRRLRDLVARLGLGDRVRFAASTRTALRERYRAADAVVFPTLWAEPFGLVPVEAMSCRTPVVATGTGGSGEFLLDQINCIIVPPGDPEALAAAVRRLAGDAGLRARLVERGLETADILDVEHFAEVTEAWHVAVAERFRHGRPGDRPSPVAGFASAS